MFVKDCFADVWSKPHLLSYFRPSDPVQAISAKPGSPCGKCATLGNDEELWGTPPPAGLPRYFEGTVATFSLSGTLQCRLLVNQRKEWDDVVVMMFFISFKKEKKKALPSQVNPGRFFFF